jgi:hyperosmotically inducible protein
MKQFLVFCGLFLMLTGIGCGPALIAGGAAAGYKAATDERTVGGIWNDSTITTKVKKALIEDPDISALKIDVDTLEGVVMLTGVVETNEAASRAVVVAQEVPGVREVKSNLQIGKKNWVQVLDDKVIGSKIKAKLINEPGIRSLNIDVDVNNGIVTLTGLVEYKYQKNRAIEIAQNTTGTIKVIDNLKARNP